MDTDGTQSADASDAFPDPTAGLISVGRPEFSVRADGAGQKAASPLRPDSEQFREMVAQAMREEAEREARGESGGDGTADGSDGESEPPTPVATLTAGGPTAPSNDGPTGITMVKRRRLPAGGHLLPQMLKGRVRRPAKLAKPVEESEPPEPMEASEPAESVETVEAATRAATRTVVDDTGSGSGWRMSAGSIGILLAVLGVLVFVTVAILFVAELLQSITGLFS